MKSSADSDGSRRETPYVGEEWPGRAMDRSDMGTPRWTKSSGDVDAPSRETPKTSKHKPVHMKLWGKSGTSTFTRSGTNLSRKGHVTFGLGLALWCVFWVISGKLNTKILQ